MTDFFISYTHADRTWAEWIGWVLEEAQYTTSIQAWDFRPGENFVVEMQKAAAGSKRTVAVLSPDYLLSLYAMAEWAAAFAADPSGEQGKLVPVLVREAKLDGLWAAIIHIPLVGLGEAAAREALLKGLTPGRARPESVQFPGAHLFPGPRTPAPDPEGRPSRPRGLASRGNPWRLSQLPGARHARSSPSRRRDDGRSSLWI
jgi:hypothetical protein